MLVVVIEVHTDIRSRVRRAGTTGKASLTGKLAKTLATHFASFARDATFATMKSIVG